MLRQMIPIIIITMHIKSFCHSLKTRIKVGGSWSPEMGFLQTSGFQHDNWKGQTHKDGESCIMDTYFSSCLRVIISFLCIALYLKLHSAFQKTNQSSLQQKHSKKKATYLNRHMAVQISNIHKCFHIKDSHDFKGDSIPYAVKARFSFFTSCDLGTTSRTAAAYLREIFKWKAFLFECFVGLSPDRLSGSLKMLRSKVKLQL